MTTLENLCAERRESRAEVFSPNSWYGFARVVRKYAAWPLPLPMVVPHGPCLDDSVWEAERTAPVPGVYAYPEHREAAYRAARDDWEVVPGCCPWLYLHAMRRSQAAGHGILAFPPHSSHHVTVSTNDDAFARQLVGLTAPESPVSVCMYWRDVQLGRHRIYHEHGLPVVSAGHIFDPRFAERLYSLIAAHESIVTVDLGSHVHFAAAIGRHVRRIEGLEAAMQAKDFGVLRRDVPAARADVSGIVERVYRTQTPLNEQQEFALRFLGGAHFKSPSDLRSLLASLAFKRGWILRCLPRWIGRSVAGGVAKPAGEHEGSK